MIFREAGLSSRMGHNAIPAPDPSAVSSHVCTEAAPRLLDFRRDRARHSAMTLQIKSTDAISGVPIVRVRSFFQHIVSWHNDSFDLPRLQEHLSLDKKSALALALELVAQGYVEAHESGTAYKFTDKGGELVRASAASKVSRKTAEDALAGLLERVEQYNRDANKILTILTVVVFGSFLGTKDKLGDLDAAVKHRYKNPGENAADAYADKSGRQFSTIIDRLSWPEKELSQILKERKRTIVIQHWDQFLRIATANPDLPYKVAFGSREEVAAEIRSRQK